MRELLNTIFVMTFLAINNSLMADGHSNCKNSKWGADDEIGAANYMNEKSIRLASKLVKKGKTHPLGIVINSKTPAFPPRSLSLTVLSPNQYNGASLASAFGYHMNYVDDILNTWVGIGSQIDGADILTSADTLEPEWTNIQNRPNGLDDGDDDTQLSQSEVVGYVENGSVNLANGSQVNSRNIVGQPSVCTGGQVLVYNASSNDWECGDDTDTTLTPTEMQTMIEAMTLNFQNRPQVSGADVLTTDSTLDPMKIDASAASDGQVLISDGSSVNWGNSGGGCEVVSKYSGYTILDCGGTQGVVRGSFTSYSQVSSGMEFNCGITSEGKILCWGNNYYEKKI